MKNPANIIETQQYKHDKSFWDEYPDFMAIKEFADLRKKHGNDVETSKVMWALYLIYHPKSVYATQPIAVRINTVEKNFLESPGFFERNPGLSVCIDAYVQLTTHVTAYVVQGLRNKLFEREMLIAETPYNRKNADFLDKLILNTDKVLNELDKAEARLSKTTSREIKGGQKLTKLAKREFVKIKSDESDNQVIANEISRENIGGN